ncbi:MAG: hypothetical protein WAW42_08910 [Candidatus Competibacteraceae bacterium]
MRLPVLPLTGPTLLNHPIYSRRRSPKTSTTVTATAWTGPCFTACSPTGKPLPRVQALIQGASLDLDGMHGTAGGDHRSSRNTTP